MRQSVQKEYWAYVLPQSIYTFKTFAELAASSVAAFRPVHQARHLSASRNERSAVPPQAAAFESKSQTLSRFPATTVVAHDCLRIISVCCSCERCSRRALAFCRLLSPKPLRYSRTRLNKDMPACVCMMKIRMKKGTQTPIMVTTKRQSLGEISITFMPNTDCEREASVSACWNFTAAVGVSFYLP